MSQTKDEINKIKEEKVFNFPRKTISINNKSNLDIFAIDC